MRNVRYDTVEYVINLRCKLTKFLTLDFSEIFYFRKANTEGQYSNDRNNSSNFQFTEVTPLEKVWQNKPLRLISYSTVR